MRVKAKERVFYDGRDREIGEEFDTLDDLHGRVLIVSGKVAEATADIRAEKRGGRNRYPTRQMRADE